MWEFKSHITNDIMLIVIKNLSEIPKRGQCRFDSGLN